MKNVPLDPKTLGLMGMSKLVFTQPGRLESDEQS